ncbi:unnamed protein product [Owenia fusiformis]|uniref:Kinetochore protein SPC25 n=1 Tax=Owenia fusiformis TaxID=6347 RepID=A0A8J1UGH8_OWEFU|nr:unnamed protein product [Owenia fusiformis]
MDSATDKAVDERNTSHDSYLEEKQLLQSKIDGMGDEVKQKSDEMAKYLAEKKKKHELMMKQGREDIAALQATLAALKTQATKNNTAISGRVDKLKSMRDDIEHLQEEADKALEDKEHLQAEVKETSEAVDKEKELLELQEKATSMRLQELEKSAEWFQDRLGLQLRKLPGNVLQFVFSCLDHQDPDRKFVFSVKVDDSGKYHISDCHPEVGGLDELVEKLNSTNNLRSFILTIRQKFKEIV